MTHHVLEHILDFPHATRMVLPHTLDRLQEPITLHRPLHGLCPAPKLASTVRPATPRERRDDEFRCQLVEVFRDEPLHSIVQLVAMFEEDHVVCVAIVLFV